ncbi:hypothetical protein X880_3349 [Burkholderia pseudomallei MSHR4032]|uniref:hypothetical protein n=1 Tax=Burkholderia pseudomallei TaxID=28450 RepID=UPI000537A79C|nr:hypothetical protein [Burkholderia pseudomallei]KGV02233.1 hypothetical protein X880_3349 [Burkholderia pseudomallei MSHR4032]
MTGKLTFHIERDGEFSVLTYKGGGCRPATPEEIELWEALLASTQQASTEIDELKAKLASYEREREDQNRYLAAQSAEIADLKQRLAQQPSGEVTDYVRVPARVVELLAIINRDGVIKRASELQEVYRLINAARAGEKQ